MKKYIKSVLGGVLVLSLFASTPLAWATRINVDKTPDEKRLQAQVLVITPTLDSWNYDNTPYNENYKISPLRIEHPSKEELAQIFPADTYKVTLLREGIPVDEVPELQEFSSEARNTYIFLEGGYSYKACRLDTPDDCVESQYSTPIKKLTPNVELPTITPDPSNNQIGIVSGDLKFPKNSNLKLLTAVGLNSSVREGNKYSLQWQDTKTLIPADTPIWVVSEESTSPNYTIYGIGRVSLPSSYRYFRFTNVKNSKPVLVNVPSEVWLDEGDLLSLTVGGNCGQTDPVITAEGAVLEGCTLKVDPKNIDAVTLVSTTSTGNKMSASLRELINTAQPNFTVRYYSNTPLIPNVRYTSPMTSWTDGIPVAPADQAVTATITGIGDATLSTNVGRVVKQEGSWELTINSQELKKGENNYTLTVQEGTKATSHNIKFYTPNVDGEIVATVDEAGFSGCGSQDGYLYCTTFPSALPVKSVQRADGTPLYTTLTTSTIPVSNPVSLSTLQTPSLRFANVSGTVPVKINWQTEFFRSNTEGTLHELQSLTSPSELGTIKEQWLNEYNTLLRQLNTLPEGIVSQTPDFESVKTLMKNNPYFSYKLLVDGVPWDGQSLSEGIHTYELVYHNNKTNTDSVVLTKSFNLDTEAPTLTKVEFVQTVGGAPVVNTERSNNEYGVFLSQGVHKVILTGSDTAGNLSSGIVKLTDAKGVTKSYGVQFNDSNTASIELPDKFKGFFSVMLMDKASHNSVEYYTNGVVAPSEETTLATQINVNGNNVGNNLFKDFVEFTVPVSDSFAGVKTVRYGVGDTVLGDRLNNIATTEGIVTSGSVTASFNTDASSTFWVEVENNVGQTSRKELPFVVDATAPVVAVAWNSEPRRGVHNAVYKGVVSVVDKTVDPSNIHTEGFTPAWTCAEGICNSPIEFSADGDHFYRVTATDKVGHEGNTVSGEGYTIDRTSPKVTLNWAQQGSRGLDNYYRTPRVATITVADKHFNPNLITKSGDGVLGSWSNTGDTWTSNVTWSTEGEHSFNLSARDEAGNVGNTVSVEPFHLDTRTPQINIQGISNGGRYYEGIPAISMTLSEDNPNPSSFVTTLKLRGKSLPVGIRWENNKAFFSFPKLDQDGEYTLTVVGADKAGNILNKEIHFVVNIKGSKFTLPESSLIGKYLNKPINVSINESSVEKLDLSKLKVELIVDGKPQILSPSDYEVREIQTSQGYFYTYIIKKKVLKKDAKYVVRVSSTSEGGRVNQSKLEYSFVLDTVSPKITIEPIVTNGIYTSDQTVDVLVRDKYLKNVDIKVNNEFIEFDDLGSGFYQFTLPVSDNPYTVKVVADDLANNSSSKTLQGIYVTEDSKFTNQFSWLLGGIIGSSLLILTLLFLLIFKRSRRKDKRH